MAKIIFQLSSNIIKYAPYLFFCYSVKTSFSDGSDFIPSEWNGSYVCSDDNRNVSYVLNVTKSDSSIGTVGTLTVNGAAIPMTGTFASFGRLLAIQGQRTVSQLVFGNNFTKVEINMRFNTSLYMTGAVVFTANSGLKTCVSELRKVAGNV